MKLFNDKFANKMFNIIYILCACFFVALVIKHYKLEGLQAVLDDYKIYTVVAIMGHSIMLLLYITFKVLDDDPDMIKS